MGNYFFANQQQPLPTKDSLPQVEKILTPGNNNLDTEEDEEQKRKIFVFEELSKMIGFQVVKVFPDSPSSTISLQEYFDFIIGIDDISVCSTNNAILEKNFPFFFNSSKNRFTDDLDILIKNRSGRHQTTISQFFFEYVFKSMNQPLKLTIFNSLQLKCLTKIIVPRTGGEGIFNEIQDSSSTSQEMIQDQSNVLPPKPNTDSLAKPQQRKNLKFFNYRKSQDFGEQLEQLNELLLGCKLRCIGIKQGMDLFWRIQSIQPDCLGARAGLQPMLDYIVGCGNQLFNDKDHIHQLLKKNKEENEELGRLNQEELLSSTGKPKKCLDFLVYNIESQNFRIVCIGLSGGESLGCQIKNGYSHLPFHLHLKDVGSHF